MFNTGSGAYRSGGPAQMTTAGANAETRINPKLPSWDGDMSTWADFRLQVELEQDGTSADDLPKLGPRLVRNLTHRAWECCSEIDRTKLKGENGVSYLLEFLEQKRGKQKVDRLGDSLGLYFQRGDVPRRDGESWTDYEIRHSMYVQAINKALKAVGSTATVPSEIFGWFLLHQFLRLEPSDAATVKSVAASYKLEDISNAMSKLWSGESLALKDLEKKKLKASGRIMLNEPSDDQPASAWFEEDAGLDSEQDGFQEWEEVDVLFEEAAVALAENPTDAECMANFQEAKAQKVKYRDARKALDKARTSRGFYPNRRPEERRPDGQSTANMTCFRCGKKGHRARQCQQRLPRAQGAATGRVGFVGMVSVVQDPPVNRAEVEEAHHTPGSCDVEAPAGYPVPGPDEIPLPVFTAELVPNSNDVFVGAVMNQHSHRHAVLDCGASESIVGVTVLQDYGDELDKMGFNPDEEIAIDRTMQRNFIFGNGQSSGALGLADVTTGILGKEVSIPFHVVDGPTPFLLSNQWLANAGATINFATGKALFSKFSDRQVQLERTSTNHLTIPLTMFTGCDETDSHFVKDSDRDVPIDELNGSPHQQNGSE